MSGYIPFVVPSQERADFTCTTLKCGNRAILIVPMNLHINQTFQEVQEYRRRFIPSWMIRDSLVEAKTMQGNVIETRLCADCLLRMIIALQGDETFPIFDRLVQQLAWVG